MRARNLRVLCRAALFAAAGGIAAGQAPPAAPRELAVGMVIERSLAGAETHFYRLDAVTGGRRLVTVEQRGIDVVVELRQADGRTLLAVDSPTDSDGPESVLLPLQAVGPLELRVLSPSPGSAPGTYAIRLEVLPTATAGERERVEAERLMTEAAARNREGGAAGKTLAATRYEEAARRFRALGDRQQEARCRLALGGLHVALGQPKPALAAYQQARELLGELADEAGQAAAWSGEGLARIALGDSVGGAEAERAALAIDRRLGRRYEEAKALNNLGFALHSEGELRAALESYRQALAAFEGVGEEGSWKASVLHNLAAIYFSAGEPDAALASNLQVLALEHSLGDRRGEARTRNSLGVLAYNRGDFGAALAAYRQALAGFQEIGDQLQQAAVLYNLGTAFYGLGDFPSALDHFAQALALRRAAGDGKGAAKTETAIGYARLRLGDTAGALDLGRRATVAATADTDRRAEMFARELVAQARIAAGEPAAAEGELATALDLARGLEDRLDEVVIRRLRGEVHLALHRPAAAAAELTVAVDLARAVESPAREVEALTALARAERQRQRPEAASSRVEEALGLIETLRTTETNPDWRASFLAAQRTAFELAIDLGMERERREPGHGYARAALEVSERAHARSLLDLLEEAHADVRAGVEPALRDRERALLARLNAKAGRQAELLNRAAPAARRQAAEGEIRQILGELAEVEAEIRRTSPRYAALTQPTPATAAEIQALLDGGSLLLEYSLGEEKSFLWAVDRGSVTGFELPPRQRIEEAARAVYRRLAALTPADAELQAAAGRLSAMVLGPVAARLGRRRLILVADGDLQYIPFGALPLPSAGGAGGVGDRRGVATALLARHEIVNVPSGSTVALERRLARPAAAAGTIAVLADPVFAPDDPRVPASTPDGGLRSPSASPSAPFLRLPWTRREAAAIAALVPANRSFLALDFRASRATALSPELTRYRIVHFATHGILDSRTPALSGLMLSRVGAHGEPLEGFLGLHDIYNLHLGADLVVLSGCETALGQEVRGEGLVGLTRAFLYGGSRQVVASLWRIEDRATAELMARFYRGLLVEGRSPAAALRRAQLSIRADQRWRSPYYWSGFVLQGDWSGQGVR